MNAPRRPVDRLVGAAFIAAVRLLTGAQARWQGSVPTPAQRIYFANHTSHGDFLLLWAALPAALRECTRPVAGGDYWRRGAVRRYLIHRAFGGVLVDRGGPRTAASPIAPLLEALAQGDSLILFPEGTRNTGDELLPFKSGLFHLARERPDVELVPAWIDNLARVMPKGEVIPVPLLCSVTFGAPCRLEPGEEKAAFLGRAQQAVLALRSP